MNPQLRIELAIAVFVGTIATCALYDAIKSHSSSFNDLTGRCPVKRSLRCTCAAGESNLTLLEVCHSK